MRADEMVTARARDLSYVECWTLLDVTPLGRLAVVHDGAPAIFPVNHVVQDRTLVFRSSRGTKRRAATAGEVAFEIDGIDSLRQEAWSVVVTGSVVEVRDRDQLSSLAETGLVSWQGGPKSHFLRLVPRNTTGRSFPIRFDQAAP